MRQLRRAALAGVVSLACLGPAAMLRADAEEAHYNAAAALYNAGQWQAAVTKIEEREKLDLPETMRARYLYAKGLAYEKGQKPAEARAAYQQIVEKHPGAGEAHAARVAMVYLDYAAGKTDAVIEAYPKLDATKLDAKQKANLGLMYAESLYAVKKDKEALDAYKAAIAAGADANAIAGKLFDLYVRQGLHNEIIAASAAAVPGVSADTQALIRTESLLALNRFAEAEAEAAKVPASSEHYGRASFAKANAMIRQNKLKEAVEPLQAAIAGMRNPAAPPAAHMALAECLLEAGRPADAEKAMETAQRQLANAPEAEKEKLRGQAALLRVRSAQAAGDRRKLIAAITQSRDALPKDQLAKVLYLRLFALSEEGDAKATLATMKDDYPLFADTEAYGPATVIYGTALRKTGRGDEAAKLLEEFVQKKPDSPEALRARLELANAALDKGDHAKARPLLDAIANTAGAADKLGKNVFDEMQFNRAIAAEKSGDTPGSIQVLTALVAAKPADELLARALPLLGQAYATQKDYANAAAIWKQALAAKPANEADLRDRLARALYAAKDHAGAIEQFDAEAKLLGEPANSRNLPRESREIWARALFETNKFAEAAAMYDQLAAAHRDTPAYAFEAGVALERAGQPAEAEKRYTLAKQRQDKLPEEYANALDARLASLRLSSGAGDMGLSEWLEKAEAAKDDAAFEAAAGALRKIAAAGKIDPRSREKLLAIANAQPLENARRYALSAIALHSLALEEKPAETRKLAGQLAADFAAHESKLDPKSSGATLAGAMIYFYKGEAERLAGNTAEALVAYETVLAAYPYNEWPDAAACGAADCYAALGDKDTAIAKYKEVLAGAEPASAAWRELATRRVAELEKK